jgi:hypothetical protein
MKKIKEFLKSFVAVVIVFSGIIGFLIIFPAIKKWENLLWGTDAKEDQINAK